MDKVQKHNSFNTNTPSSESYRNYINILLVKNFVYHINLSVMKNFQFKMHSQSAALDLSET
jgi:hypothetical protein